MKEWYATYSINKFHCLTKFWLDILFTRRCIN